VERRSWNTTIEDAVLALLAIFSSDGGNAWKGFDVEARKRLHEHRFISNPVKKNKSIWLTAEELERGRQIADRLPGSPRLCLKILRIV